MALPEMRAERVVHLNAVAARMPDRHFDAVDVDQIAPEVAADARKAVEQRRGDRNDVPPDAALLEEEFRQQPERAEIAQKPAVEHDAGIKYDLMERDFHALPLEIGRIGKDAEQLCADDQTDQRADHQKQLPHPVLFALDAKKQSRAEHREDADRSHDRIGQNMIPDECNDGFHARYYIPICDVWQ